MRVKNAAPPIIFAMLFAFQAQALAQDPKIGSAEAAKNHVEGIIGGQSGPVSKGTALFTNETVRTGENGLADLVFLDSTNLTVGPISEVLLDKFVYDPNGSSGIVVLQATKGAFRFVTGSQDKRAYQIQTPFGNLGVRGTIVELMCIPCESGMAPSDCGITLRLVEGAATFTTPRGETINLPTGAALRVDGSGHSSLASGTGTILPREMAALIAEEKTASLPRGGPSGDLSYAYTNFSGSGSGSGTNNNQNKIGGSLGLDLLNINKLPSAATTPSNTLPLITTTTTITTTSSCMSSWCR